MSYSNNPNSLVAGSGIAITPTSGTGANAVEISALGSSIVTVRNAVATPVTVVDTDQVVSIQVPGSVAVQVNLPVGVIGRVFDIKDGLGLASVVDPITISPAAGTIDGAASATIDVSYGSITLVYNGTEWLII